jgi:hypothetical protein
VSSERAGRPLPAAHARSPPGPPRAGRTRLISPARPPPPPAPSLAPRSKAAKLAAGDAASLLLFAVIGRASHGEPLDGEVLATALPFMLGAARGPGTAGLPGWLGAGWVWWAATIGRERGAGGAAAAALQPGGASPAPAGRPAGWFPAAALLGAFGKEAQGSSVPAAAGAAAKAWAVGIPTGLVFRAISRGYVPPTPFIVVSLVRGPRRRPRLLRCCAGGCCAGGELLPRCGRAAGKRVELGARAAGGVLRQAPLCCRWPPRCCWWAGGPRWRLRRPRCAAALSPTGGPLCPLSLHAPCSAQHPSPASCRSLGPAPSRAPRQAPKLTPAQQLAQRKNKQGNPFEFLGLLASLVKRW